MNFLRGSTRCFVIAVTLSCCLGAQSASAQSSGGPELALTANNVPRLVNFSGRAADAQGMPVFGTASIIFSIYKDQYEGAPLWLETQNVQPDAKGNYTVKLGAGSSQGLPLELFASGEARWLGVRINGGEEQPRVLLLSVPYALKAADAQTLAGLPASAFVLAPPPANGSNSSNPTISTNAASPNVGGTGTQNYIPIWTDSVGDLGNSVLYQLGTGTSAKLGINLTNPLLTLDVNGSELVRGLFEMATTGFATPTKAYNSQPLNIESSAFNSSTKKYTLNHFQWQAEATGNNTSTPGATLNLLYGTDPAAPTETGLSLNSKGIFTFAPGQTFPGGGGTITGVTAGVDLTGGGTSGNVTLNVDTTKVPQLNSANVFTQPQTVNSSNCCVSALTATGPDEGLEGDSPNSGVVGIHTGSGAGSGLFGKTSSQSGYGVEGNNAGGGVGVYGVTSGPATAGVMGVNGNTTTGGYGVFGSSPSGMGVYGVSSVNGYGVYGIAEGGPGVYGTTAGGTSGFSGTSAGVWGDNSNSSTSSVAGVLGTANATGTGSTWGVEGVWGSPSGAGTFLAPTDAGVWGDSSQKVGVSATSDSSNALFAENQSQDFFTIFARNDDIQDPTNTTYVFATVGNFFVGGNCTIDSAGDLACSGTKSAVVPVSNNRQVALYAVEAPENWFEDFGSGQLVNGAATITLERTFTETVNLKLDYHVFLTPNGNCKGLYVQQKSPSSFEVRELGDGTSNVMFDYRIVAKRLGYENQRLVDMHDRSEKLRAQFDRDNLHRQASPPKSSGR